MIATVCSKSTFLCCHSICHCCSATRNVDAFHYDSTDIIKLPFSWGWGGGGSGGYRVGSHWHYFSIASSITPYTITLLMLFGGGGRGGWCSWGGSYFHVDWFACLVLAASPPPPRFAEKSRRERAPISFMNDRVHYINLLSLHPFCRNKPHLWIRSDFRIAFFGNWNWRCVIVVFALILGDNIVCLVPNK